MADTYAGAWRTRVMGVTDDSQPLGSADPARHMTSYDAGAHNVDDTATTRRQTNASWALDLPPDALTDVTDSSAAMQLPSNRVPIDMESRDHANGDVNWSMNNTLRDQVIPTSLHGRDRMSMWARKIRAPRWYQWDEKLTTPRILANPTVDGSEGARVRGSNFAGMDPRNNPKDTEQRTRGDVKQSGSTPPVGRRNVETRIGYRVFRFDERKFPMHYVRHDTRWLPVRVAKTAQDAPQPLTGNQYVSPFATLAQTRQRIAASPMLRRVPNAWDATAVTDGSETPETEQYSSWGL